MQSKKDGRFHILIYGSTLLTEKCIEAIELHSDKYRIVGQIPNVNAPLVKGKISYYPPRICESTGGLPYATYDIKLSIQYDKIIKDVTQGFNLHTGLLPEWGGCDILYHTLKSGIKEQGLTFHKMTEKLDEGPIISKVTYPILSDDTIEKMYRRILRLAPSFTIACLDLISKEKLTDIPILKPTLYKKGQIEEEDRAQYIEIGKRLESFK